MSQLTVTYSIVATYWLFNGGNYKLLGNYNIFTWGKKVHVWPRSVIMDHLNSWLSPFHYISSILGFNFMGIL